jgi:predicted TIM-barrel fold metal-dependent hydrolase
VSISEFIDVHTHVLRPEVKDAPPMTVEELLKRMDELGIERAVVLPIVSPEGGFFYYPTESVLQLYERFPAKLIPFCNIDPRCSSNSPSTDFRWVLSEYRTAGCRGLGEITANVYFDDVRVLNLFRQCGEIGFPVLFHMAVQVGGVYGLADDIGLPRLERALSSLPQTIFIGHAMSFWAEISGEVDPLTRGDYPKGIIRIPGRLAALLSKYENLYGDLSAGSGYNAISRDPEYGCKFLEEFQDKLFFGTDICNVNQDVPIVGYLRALVQQGKISRKAFRKISRDNVSKVLGL